MADCPLLPTCLFFNDKMAEMPTLAHVYKRKFCRDDFAACARYRVYQVAGRAAVPQDLLPNQPEVADRLLEDRGSRPGG